MSNPGRYIISSYLRTLRLQKQVKHAPDLQFGELGGYRTFSVSLGGLQWCCKLKMVQTKKKKKVKRQTIFDSLGS